MPLEAQWNPTYPQRAHIHERVRWSQEASAWQRRVDAARGELGSKRQGDEAARLLAGMQGACDQIRDAAARLPLEVGDLYEEDHHRLHEAVAAAERLLTRWASLT